MFIDVTLVLLALPALLAAGYLFVLAILSRRPMPAPCPPSRLRFDVVVPAHDEEAGIERTVRSLLALDWPAHRYRVLVVADNCSDRTAERARAAGAEVLVRDDPTRRGKGYALQRAFSGSWTGTAPTRWSSSTPTPRSRPTSSPRSPAGSRRAPWPCSVPPAS